MKFVFVSPHYDDAIGSCGCLIGYLANNGYETEGLTIFGEKCKESISNFANTILSFCGLSNGVLERKLENKQACKILNTVDRNLFFQDAIFRQFFEERWLYNSFQELFSSIKNEDLLLQTDILSEMINRYSKENTILFFPSAKRGHVDHIIVNKVGIQLKKMNYHTNFYNEFIYNQNYISNEAIVKYRLEFTENDLYRKITAMMAYKSQHKMLFENSDIYKYYLNNNMMNGRVFEIYYAEEYEYNNIKSFVKA